MAEVERGQAPVGGLVAPDAEGLDRSTHLSGPPQQRTGRGPSRARRDFFSLLALIPVGIYLVKSTYLVAPWAFVLTPDEPDPDPHRWFYAVSAAAGLFILVSFAVLMNRLQRPALAATVGTSFVLALVAIVPFQPESLVVLVFTAPAILVYPYWRDLRDLGRGWAEAHRWLLIFAVTVCAGLLAVAVVAMRKQIVNDGAVADAHLWNGYAAHLALIALVGVIAAVASAGSLLLRGLLGAVWVYLGAVAALALPDATGSWGVWGGVTGIAIGVVFLVSTWWDRRRALGRTSPQPRQRPEESAVPQQRHHSDDAAQSTDLPLEDVPH